MPSFRSTPPNVLLILVDDMGLSDLSCYGSEIQTPNIYAIADNYPTHVVGMSQPSVASVVAPGTTVYKVQIGYAKLRYQRDKLFSITGNGGGSEVMICRASGYLKYDGQQITSFQDVIPVNFTRRDIRKGKWVRIYSTWDPDWNVEDKEQVLTVYEDDNANEVTVSGSIETTIKLSDNSLKIGPLSYSIKVKTQDAILRQIKLDRNSYFLDANNDQGHGEMGGWPIYDNGNRQPFAYTMPYTVISN